MLLSFSRLAPLLQQHPYLSNSCLGFCISASGDQCAQLIERRSRAEKNTSNRAPAPHQQGVDFVRSFLMGSWSFLVYAPLAYRAYHWVSTLPFRCKGKLFLSLQRGATSNTIMNLPFCTAFFAYMTCAEALVEKWRAHRLGERTNILGVATSEEATVLSGGWGDAGRDVDASGADSTAVLCKIREKYEKDLLPTVFVNMCVWIPGDTLNYALVPPPYRVLVSSAMSAGWNTFLSLVQHRDA